MPSSLTPALTATTAVVSHPRGSTHTTGSFSIQTARSQARLRRRTLQRECWQHASTVHKGHGTSSQARFDPALRAGSPQWGRGRATVPDRRGAPRPLQQVRCPRLTRSAAQYWHSGSHGRSQGFPLDVPGQGLRALGQGEPVGDGDAGSSLFVAGSATLQAQEGSSYRDAKAKRASPSPRRGSVPGLCRTVSGAPIRTPPGTSQAPCQPAPRQPAQRG